MSLASQESGNISSQTFQTEKTDMGKSQLDRGNTPLVNSAMQERLDYMKRVNWEDTESSRTPITIFESNSNTPQGRTIKIMGRPVENLRTPQLPGLRRIAILSTTRNT